MRALQAVPQPCRLLHCNTRTPRREMPAHFLLRARGESNRQGFIVVLHPFLYGMEQKRCGVACRAHATCVIGATARSDRSERPGGRPVSRAGRETPASIRDHSHQDAYTKAYGLHLIADTRYEIPVALEVTKASASEPVREFFAKDRDLVERCSDFSADRGLDSAGRKKTLWDDYRIRPLIGTRQMWREEKRFGAGTGPVQDAGSHCR